MKSLIGLITLLLLSTGSMAQSFETGREVIRAMHQRYSGDWYEYLSFKQKTQILDVNTGAVAREETWYESLKIPGHLGIKINDPEGGDGILFLENTQYGFQGGEIIQEVPRVHDLLVLGFDIYRQDPELTIKALESIGYDLDQIYEDTWQGREVYVIGTNLPDNRKPQFWIDKERLLFVRSLKTGRQNSRQEVQFNKYERLGGGWIAPEVIFKVNDKVSLKEKYYQITLPDSISEDFFDPDTFVATEW